ATRRADRRPQRRPESSRGRPRGARREAGAGGLASGRTWLFEGLLVASAVGFLLELVRDLFLRLDGLDRVIRRLPFPAPPEVVEPTHEPPSLLVRLCGAETLGERLQERPRHLRVILDERLELPGSHPVCGHVGRSGDRRGTRALVDKRDLTEIVAGAERRPSLAADAHRGAPLRDDEEACAAGALARHRAAFRETALFHLVRQA